MSNFGTVEVTEIAHLFGMSSKHAVRVANEQGLPIKAFKLGGKRSPWLVSETDLEKYIAQCAKDAAEEFDAVNGA